MAATKEAKVKKKVKEILDALQVYYFFPPANGYGRAGIPDVVGCIDGWFIAIECKAGKGKTTALQERELQRIADAGGFAWVVYETDLEELEDNLRCLKQTS
jgi:Holliday junction resolvase